MPNICRTLVISTALLVALSACGTNSNDGATSTSTVADARTSTAPADASATTQIEATSTSAPPTTLDAPIELAIATEALAAYKTQSAAYETFLRGTDLTVYYNARVLPSADNPVLSTVFSGDALNDAEAVAEELNASNSIIDGAILRNGGRVRKVESSNSVHIEDCVVDNSTTRNMSTFEETTYDVRARPLSMRVIKGSDGIWRIDSYDMPIKYQCGRPDGLTFVDE